MKKPSFTKIAALAVGLLVWGMAGEALADDFEELPLVPLAPPFEAEEDEEEAVGEAAPDEEAAHPESEDLVQETNDEVEEPRDPRLAKEARARPGAGAIFAGVTGGAHFPLAGTYPTGAEGGVVVERPLSGSPLRLRADLTFASHGLEDARILPGLGLDAGFQEVSNLLSLLVGISWRPLDSSSGPFLRGGLGVTYTMTERRVFSAESSSSRLRPAAVVGAGFDLSAGPGRVRLEGALHGRRLAVGPDDSPLAESFAGLGLSLSYKLPL